MEEHEAKSGDWKPSAKSAAYDFIRKLRAA